MNSPAGNGIRVTDEKLLANVRSIKGEFFHNGLHVFYYEYFPTD